MNNADNGTATISAFGGSIGGIVGKNGIGGRVAGTNSVAVSSGKNWTIKANKTENVQYIGGIVGSSETSEVIEYVDNWAKFDVKEAENANAITGGIVGYINQANTANIRYARNCEDINGYGITGGIVGQVNGGGVTFTNCSNHGDITNEYNAVAGCLRRIFERKTADDCRSLL